MPEVSPEQLARQIHDRPHRLVIAVTGGGSAAISTLLCVSGASRSVLAAAVPYAAEALVEWVGGKPDEFCSSWTARAMAMAAFLRAQKYDPAADTLGIACTASLASDRPKRGTHRAHLAYQTATTTAECFLELEKGRRSRAEEELVVTGLILNHLAEACQLESRVALSLVASERTQVRKTVAPQDQQDLLAGRLPAVALGAAREKPKPLALFPGAFHPLHEAHRKMAGIAEQLLGVEVAFEISILNVDKPPLDFLEIDDRTRQFSADQNVWLSRAPNFTEKAKLFPGATFVVGADTIERIGQVRYYGGQPAALEAAIEQIAAKGCRFLVFARALEGRSSTLAELQLPDSLARLCEAVPESTFRVDVSSTQLRRQGE